MEMENPHDPGSWASQAQKTSSSLVENQVNPEQEQVQGKKARVKIYQTTDEDVQTMHENPT